jgi:hypothetical protein
VEGGFKGRGLKLLVLVALVCGRKRTGEIEQSVRWFCGNAVVGSEEGCAAGLKGREQGFR